MATLLYCDDDFKLRQFVLIALRETPHLVSIASDGLEALALVEEHTPDLVLTDLHMPRCGGLELVDRLKTHAAFARLPVVLVTADDLAPHDYPASVAAVLPKPFRRADLLAVIDAVLGTERAAS